MEVAQRSRGTGFPALKPPPTPPDAHLPHAVHHTEPDVLPLPRMRGHSTKSHAALGEVTALARGLFVLTGCIHYSSGKVRKDPAQHPEA